jgi:hypothetical protein
MKSTKGSASQIKFTLASQELSWISIIGALESTKNECCLGGVVMVGKDKVCSIKHKARVCIQ